MPSSTTPRGRRVSSERSEPAYRGRSARKVEDVRLLKGKGRYVDDFSEPHLLHAAFVRSPFPHARITSIDAASARDLDGVVAVFTASDLESICRPWSGLLNWPGMKAGDQRALADGVVRHVGEPVVMVIARSRAIAEDGVSRVVVEYDERAALIDPVEALANTHDLVHEDLGTNLALALTVGNGPVEQALESAAHTVTVSMQTGRHTATAMEPRGVIADASLGDGTLTVRISTQASHMLQATYASIFGIAESRIRILAEDVGGAFGMKAHVYPDEVATCAASIVLSRPVKWIQDRAEAFQSDTVARDERVTATLGLDEEGMIVALRAEVVSDGGAYSVYPRSMVSEGIQTCTIMPGPYVVPAFHAELRVAITNKTPLSVYRGVGHPPAILVMESLMDLAAERIGLPREELRRRNLIASDAFPFTSVSGSVYDSGSYVECLETLVDDLGGERVATMREEAARRGRVLGVGIACFVEMTAPGAEIYGARGAPITAHDQVAIRMEPDGTVVILMGTAGQGQGLRTTASQLVAERLGIHPEDVTVVAGDTDRTPHGSGVWGSRSGVVTTAAADDAGQALRRRLVELAAHLLEAAPEDVELAAGRAQVRGTSGEGASLSLAEVAEAAHYRSFLFPEGTPLELSMVGVGYPTRAVFNNGAHAAFIELDPELGTVDVLAYWVVEDCGVLVNPAIVDEQIRGGVAQGLGGALFEHLLYDEAGQLLTTTMLDYHIPTADTVPDIVIKHIETPSPLTPLGTKGAGEAGAAGAPAAIHGAVNDALTRLGAGRVWQQPITPELVFNAIGDAREGVRR